MAVVVLDPHGAAIMPCSEKRARGLLERGRARVHPPVPFVIRLTDRHAGTCAFLPLRIKFDPDSKITSIALVRETGNAGVAVLNCFELIHRGRQISEALTARRSMRRRRRGNLRDRAPRFLNRRKPAGWLAPSWQHRVDNAMSWVRRFPVSSHALQEVPLGCKTKRSRLGYPPAFLMTDENSAAIDGVSQSADHLEQLANVLKTSADHFKV